MQWIQGYIISEKKDLSVGTLKKKRASKILKIELLYDQSFPLMGFIFKEIEMSMLRDICIPVLMAAHIPQ